MNWIRFSDLGEDPRSAMQGQRWLVMTAHDLPHATAALAFSELEDVLVAVDHRGVHVEHGLWMRAVHLMIVSDTATLQPFRPAVASRKSWPAMRR